MEFRTPKQFEEICDSAINGNWSVAFEECEKYGFYSNDLINAYQEDNTCGIEVTDLAILAEGAEHLRK